MGLGFTMRFPVNSTTMKKKQYTDFFASLKSILPSWRGAFYNSADGFQVNLVPFEESIYGTWEGDMLSVSAKTSSAGPGYHAWLIDMLDGLGLEPVEVEDETGYYESRDFNALQKSMADWLQNLSGQLIELASQDDVSNLAVSLSIDWCPIDAGHFTCCPLGYFEKDYFQKLEAGEQLAHEFFIWWNKEQDASFFRNIALNLIWCNVNWLPPESKAEKGIITATLDCLENAYEMESGLDYPAAEWMELALLMDDTPLQNKLKSRFGDTGNASLGYSRQMISSNVFEWRITHTGMMHFEVEEGGDWVWWDNDRTIRVSTFSLKLKDDTKNNQAMLTTATKDEEGCEPFNLRNPEIAACIQHSQFEEDGDMVWQTRLTAALHDKLLVVSIFYENESDRDWAIAVCASAT